jgi:hypothetical protein
MGNWSDIWSYLNKLWLIKSYFVWVFPAGGFVTGYFVYGWSLLWGLPSPVKFTLALVCGVFSMILLLLIDYIRRPKVKGVLTPVAMNSADARLTFKNKGRKADFFVKCEFTSQINADNMLPNVVYDLAWENQTVKMLSVANGDSAHLMLATWGTKKSGVKAFGDEVVTHETGVAELRAFGKEQPEHFLLWNCEPNEKLPTCDVKVTVLSDGGRGKLERFFTLEPKHYWGPLQISEYFPLSKDGKKVAV